MLRRLAIFGVVATLCSASHAFVLDDAIRGVFYSKAAYCLTEHIAVWNCTVCAKFPAMKNATAAVDTMHDAAGWVGYNAGTNEIVVAFRGTIDITGWIVDLDFPQVDYVSSSGKPCAGCKVHQGFYWAWLRLRPALRNAAVALANAYPDANLFVTGHSMGAAIAGLAYSELVNVVNVSGTKRMYNFGSPRIGNAALVAFLDLSLEPRHEHYRSTNFGDPVVHVPPTMWDHWGGIWGDWLHIPREVFFQNAFAPPQSDFRVCNGNATAEDPTCANSTPWYDLIDFRNHTTYLDIGLGCFLGPTP